MRTVSVKLPDRQFRRLQKLARETGIPFDELLQAAVKNLLDDEGWLLSQNKPLMARLRKSRRDELAGRNIVDWENLKED